MEQSTPRSPSALALAAGRAAAWLEALLLAGGLACIGWVGFVIVDSSLFHVRESALLRREQPADPGPVSHAPVGASIALLEAPRLGLDVVVVEGTTDRVLRRAAGHLEGSAPPGGRGNVVIAGHRDTFFRSLADVRRGDLLRVTSRRGSDLYEVAWTRVVEPSQVEVLADQGTPMLTLVTCFPFRYIGNAPQRFVVRARHVQGPAGVVEPAVDRRTTR